MAGETMAHISTITVTGAASDVQFTNIPQTFTDLQVFISAKGRTNGPGFGALVVYTVTSQSSSLSTWKNLEGTGTGVSSYNAAQPIVGIMQHLSTATYGSTSVYIPNYTSSNEKFFSGDAVTEANQAEVRVTINALKINYTSPITFLGFGDGSYGGGLGVGSTISLYGILKGSGGATVS